MSSNLSSIRKEDIDELFTDLKVLGSIKQNQKLYTNGHQIRVDDESIFQPATRFFFGESRAANMRSIKRVLQQANTVVDLYMQNSPRSTTSINVVSRLQKELQNAVLGLANLQSTYDNDMTTLSTISVLIENINETINTIHTWQRKVSSCSTPSSPAFTGTTISSHD